MNAPPPRRPRWKKKRWAAALASWLVVAYPLGLGPAEYAAARGWLSYASKDVMFRPVDRILPRYDGLYWKQVLSKRQLFAVPNRRTRWLYAYADWWAALGVRHRTTSD